MAFVIKTVKTLRNHWKKSTFASVALLYGYSYVKSRFETQELMRVYCEKAARYGGQAIPVDVDPRNVTVILNPNANKRKASDEFDKYCAPILHLAGICVTVLKTESEGHAKTLIEGLTNADAIVVAGGDGTFSEVITGLLRRTQENTNGLIPLGILPLGQTNSTAKRLFSGGNNVEKVRALADATMAVVEQAVKPINVLKIEVMEGENQPIYAVSGIKWGAYRDAENKKNSYWVYGRFRKYATYLFNGYKSSLSWHCDATINYSPPCKGCSNCTKAPPTQKWYQRFGKAQQLNYFNVVNPECEMIYEKNMSTVDFTLSAPEEETPKLRLTIGPRTIDYFDFVREGWRSEKGEKRKVEDVIEARSVEIRPKIDRNVSDEAWFSIDNENFELKPIKVTILPNLIKVFCRKENL